MTKKELPPCSRRGYEYAASIVFNGVLLCGTHANDALEMRRQALIRDKQEGSGDQPLERE